MAPRFLGSDKLRELDLRELLLRHRNVCGVRVVSGKSKEKADSKELVRGATKMKIVIHVQNEATMSATNVRESRAFSVDCCMSAMPFAAQKWSA